MRSLLIIVVVLIASSAFAQIPTVSERAADLKTISTFFTDSNNLSLSGCDREAWELIYKAAQMNMQTEEVSLSSARDDGARADKVTDCFRVASEKERQTYQSLYKRLQDRNNDDLNVVLLRDDGTLNSIKIFAEQAYKLYSGRAEETRYRNLVERYDALVNSLARVRLAEGSSFPIQPRPLHCESSTNPATGITQLNCQ